MTTIFIPVSINALLESSALNEIKEEPYQSFLLEKSTVFPGLNSIVIFSSSTKLYEKSNSESSSSSKYSRRLIAC